MRISLRTIVIVAIAAIAAIVLAAILFFNIGRQQPSSIPVTLTGPSEIQEGGDGTLTCTATTNRNLRIIDLFRVPGFGDGALGPDLNPNPKIVEMVYTPTELGKTRQPSFNCQVADVNGNAGSKSL